MGIGVLKAVFIFRTNIQINLNLYSVHISEKSMLKLLNGEKNYENL